MTIDPVNAWGIVIDGKVKHVRLSKAQAEACANIERDIFGEAANRDIKVVPVLMTEIKNPDA